MVLGHRGLWARRRQEGRLLGCPVLRAGLLSQRGQLDQGRSGADLRLAMNGRPGLRSEQDRVAGEPCLPGAGQAGGRVPQQAASRPACQAAAHVVLELVALPVGLWVPALGQRRQWARPAACSSTGLSGQV